MIAPIAPAAWTALVAQCEAAWPDEACGWLAGDAALATDLHPAAIGGRDQFGFADDDLLALTRAYRHGPRPRLLYHSHPRGPATLSAADRGALAPAGVVLHPLPHLVIAVAERRATAATLYDWRDGEPRVLARAHRDGAGRWHATLSAASP